MSLSSNVQSRYSSEFLVNVTNPQLSTATTLDAARLALAVTDAEGMFKIYAGTIYDDNDSTHVATGVSIVVDLCRYYTAQVTWKELEPSIKARFDALKQIDARDKVLPTSNSALEETEDAFGAKPLMDPANFQGMVPDSSGPEPLNS